MDNVVWEEYWLFHNENKKNDTCRENAFLEE